VQELQAELRTGLQRNLVRCEQTALNRNAECTRIAGFVSAAKSKKPDVTLMCESFVGKLHARLFLSS
jgi:hypothetical protein